MSITKNKSLTKTLLCVLAFTFFSLLFIGCDNFLKGEAVKNDILDSIAYNNAPSYQIRVECEKTDGLILTETILTKKETDIFKIEFRMEAGLQFKTWKAYSKDAQGAEVPLSDEYIEFLDYNTTATDNVYKATVKFKKNANDITIKPVCLLIPKVESILPSLTPSGCEQDTSIEIKFNKAVDADAFADGSIISIYTAEGDIKEYFNTPVLAADNKTLIISPKAGEHILALDSNTKLDITVKIDLTNIVDSKDSLPFTLCDPHTYRINDTFKGQQTVTFQVAKNEYGNFLSDGEMKCTLNNYVDLHFTLKKDEYVFDGLEAVSSNSSTLGQSRADCVSFQTLNEENDDSGVYKIRVTILKNQPDIKINALGRLLPKIVSISPQSMPIIVAQDTPIIITFNKPVDTESFGDFSCITIDSAGTDLKDYFETPVFSDQDQVLTINPDTNKLILVPDSGDKLDITVTIDFSNVKDAQGLGIAAHAAHTYRINDTVDSQNLILQSAEVEITGTNGKFNPIKGKYNIIQTYSKQLGFEPDADYGFICWQIYDKATDEEIPNGTYIKIADPTIENTTYDLINKPAAGTELGIRPVVAERPQILSATPAYDPAGVWRDTTIYVVFDFDMDEDSILYTEPEETQIRKDPTKTLIPSSVYPGRFFGYKQIDEDGYEQSYYKNIMIQDKTSGENLTKYYGEPIFENATTLYIPVVNSTTFKVGQNIVVMIGKDFCYKVIIGEGENQIKKPVYMNKTEKWLYLSNGRTDGVAPTYSMNSFSISGTSISQTNIDSNANPSIPALQIQKSSDIKNALTGKRITSSSITLNIQNLIVNDTGSYPYPHFYAVYKKLYDVNYEPVSKLPEKFPVIYDSVVGANATFTGTVLMDGFDEGVYEISLEIRDNGSGVSQYPAGYIVKDTTSPKKASNLKYKYYDNSNLELLWTEPASQIKDFDHYKIEYETNSVSRTEYVPGTPVISANSIFGFNKNKSYYKFYVSAVDALGNVSDAISTYFDKTDFEFVKGATVSGPIAGSNIFIEGRTVTIPDIFVCNHEVTQEEFLTYCNYTSYDPAQQHSPSGKYGKGDNYPAYCVNWYTAIMYCNKRSIKEGYTPVYSLNGETDPSEWNGALSGRGPESRNYTWDTGITFDQNANGYRLPTEVEWEYIAREGNNGIPSTQYSYSGSNTINYVAWYKQNSSTYYSSDGKSYNSTHPVKQKDPNALGIYDMSGNADEWCYDWSGQITTSTSYVGSDCPPGGDGYHVYRGGTYRSEEGACKNSSRTSSNPYSTYFAPGFRVVRNAQ